MGPGEKSTRHADDAFRVAVAAGLLVALPLALVVGAPGRLPLFALGALAGAAGLAGVAAFAGASALARLLFLASVAFAFVPFDKYFGYVEHVGGWPGLRVGASDVALLPLLPLAALGWWLGRVRNAVPGPVLVVYALLLAQYVLSSFGAPRRDLAAFELAGAVHAIVLAVVVAALYRREALVPILIATALAVVVHAAAGGAEFALRRPVGPGSAQREALQEVLSTGAVRLRPSGLMVHPIVLADFFLMTLPALGAAAFAVRRDWLRLALAGIVLLGAGVLGITLSRGAWASTLFAAMVLVALAASEGLLRDPATRRRLFGVVVVGCLCGLAFAPVAYQRLTKSDPGNVRVRHDLNDVALAMTQANPLRGVGLNNFIVVFDQYDPKNIGSYFAAPAHNLYLLESAEAGLPGAALFVAFVATLIVTAVRRLRAARASADLLTRWVAAGLIASLCGLALSQVADFSWRLEPLRTIVWMQVGLVFGMLRPAGASSGAPLGKQLGTQLGTQAGAPAPAPAPTREGLA